MRHIRYNFIDRTVRQYAKLSFTEFLQSDQMKFISAQMTAIDQCRHAYWDIFYAGSIARNNCALNVNVKYLVTEFNYAKNKIVEIIWRFRYTVTLPNKIITLIKWRRLK